MDSVAGVSMNSQTRSIKVIGYYDVHGRVIKENLVKRHPELAGCTLNVCPTIGAVKVDIYGGVFPEGAQETFDEIMQAYVKPAPQKVRMPTWGKHGRKTSIKPLAGEWL